MTNANRDLAAPELWSRSLERSRRRRELLPKARRELGRRKHVSAALATAMFAGPGAPLAAAQISGAGVSAAVAAESPANRAIEVREGGLPLQLGSQGDLVAEVQRALHVPADGIFGVQTDAAVRSYQRGAGLQVDGIVGLATWGSLFKGHSSSGASIGTSNIPLAARQRVEQVVEQAGAELAAQGRSQGGAEPSAPGADTGTSGTTAGGTAGTTTPTSTPAPTGGACGSSTISSPLHGTMTSDFGPRGGRNHDGIDIAAPTGTPVRAAACGTVSVAGQQSGYGNIVCITHTSQFTTCYAHLSRFGVTSGTRVQQGQVIGYVGCTGSCTGPHLHFETRVGGTARDPEPYLDGASIPGASATTSRASTVGAGTSPASATTASQGGSATTIGTQATVTQSSTSATTTGDSLESTTTGAATGSVVDPTTATAAPGGGDYSATAPAAGTTAPAEPVAASTAPAEPTVDATVPSTAPSPAAEPVATAPAAEPVATAPAAEPVATAPESAPAAAIEAQPAAVTAPPAATDSSVTGGAAAAEAEAVTAGE